MVVMHAYFLYEEGKTQSMHTAWQPSTHGGHQNASLLKKTEVDTEGW